MIAGLTHRKLSDAGLDRLATVAECEAAGKMEAIDRAKQRVPAGSV